MEMETKKQGYRGIVTIPENFSAHFRLVRKGKPREEDINERYYYHGLTVRNLKVICNYPLEEIQGKVAAVTLSWDDNSKRPEDAPKLMGRAASAQGFWRLYIYPIEATPEGKPASSNHTIFISFTDLPVKEKLISEYKRFDLYPFGTMLFGKKHIPTPKTRILAMTNELQQISDSQEINPITLLQAEQKIRRLIL